MKRRISVVAVLAVLAVLDCSTAIATEVRPIAHLPSPVEPIIRNVSTDGRQLLVETGTTTWSLWSVNALTGATRLLFHPYRYAAAYRLSPNGAWVGWAVQSQHRPTAVYLARTDGTAAPLRLGLPPNYSHAGVLELTVTSSGRVTLLTSDKPAADGQNATAVLSAGPGASTFTQVVRATGPSYLERGVMSQDGRVFALCDEVARHAGDNGETGEVMVVSSEPELRVSRATGRFSLPGTLDCLPSDRGTATMMLSQHVPGAGRSQRRDFRSAVVTAGLGRGKPLYLAPGTGASELEAVSPSGRQAIISDYTGTVLTVLNLKSGRQQTVHVARAFGRAGRLRLRVSPMPNRLSYPTGQFLRYAWDPFTDVVDTTIYGPQEHALVLNLSSGQWMPPLATTNGRDSLTQTCFLPNGRVLVTGSTPGPGADSARLFVSNPERSSFTLASTQALGVVYSISCEAAASGHIYLASEGTGTIYEVDVSGIDGSGLMAVPVAGLP
jgi:hypothetical protein